MELKEPELFDYLKEFYYSDLEKSEEFDNWDCISLEAKMFIELKSRKTHYPDLLIEESKYQGLIMAAGIRSLTPWYINATPEGIWALIYLLYLNLSGRISGYLLLLSLLTRLVVPS